NKIPFQPEWVDLPTLLQEKVRNLESLAQTKSIRIDLHIESSPQRVFVDRNMVKSILRNLLANAVKYSNIGQAVTLISRPSATQRGYTEIEVRDEGVGIPVHLQAKIFSTDQTVSTKGTWKEGGTGLGLLISKE
ncbi:HAMP domain-containing sensor histidine kinase, partial [Arthrospira platensis SPKY1]|nr:HAMP domain-containing sensor histidine kinase [Arthrospira platensis SPKY1]